MTLRTRLTEQLGLSLPIISAPMAFAAGAKLATAVSASGGLGLIGGGYGDPGWAGEQFKAAGNHAVGCGFITWAITNDSRALDVALSYRPRAIMLSFGDPAPHVAAIKGAGALLICQIQTRRDAEHALDCGADVLVAQGAEAGGHGEKRATFTLVPEVADLISAKSPRTLLCAAGGIADGRGLAGALMLGADGALVGSRLWASSEANVSPSMHAAALAATGDDTIRSQVMDIARRLDWPQRYTARVLRNAFTARWHGHEDELARVADEEAVKYRAAWAAGDAGNANTFVGEAAGLIHTIEPARDILERMVCEACECLTRYR